MSNDPLDPFPTTVLYTTTPPADWGTALVFACFGLGLLLGWGTYEMRQRISQDENIRRFRHEMDDISSRQNDLGHLMSNPRTKFIRLIPTDSITPLASVAWNVQSQSGAIFCDSLAAGAPHRYQLHFIPAAGDATTLQFGPTEPGQNIYPLHTAAGQSASPNQIILTTSNEISDPPQPDQELARGTLKDED